ncbi:metallophosphoesterase family protein [Sphingomonas sp. S2-65]|uniref:metallophosphoesterase family protein n=1 Tax=Sphingomonas sp. S2-65 TaxID=2903960 RepID=UPI001F3063DB|nr:metallophosphoesterase family protein [Sphingomonas sp. S2-65]UYY57048.1 serine/threonine protein phosphatase [Sphingomonas sp. S2-65]
MAIEIHSRAFEAPMIRGWRSRRARTAGQRLIAIGDVHGRWDLLDALLKAIEQHIATTPEVPSRLIILGDFIDRGPDSARVLRFLRSVTRQSERATVLLGNHEQALLHTIEGDTAAQRLWLAHGAAATLASFDTPPPQQHEFGPAFAVRAAQAIGPETIDWLRDLPLSLRIGDYFFCHAGVRPGRKLDRQSGEDLLWIREAFLADQRSYGAIVVHGHSIVGEAEIRHNRIAVDTGAYRTGLLSAVILDEPRNWVVSVRQTGNPGQSSGVNTNALATATQSWLSDT